MLSSPRRTPPPVAPDDRQDQTARGGGGPQDVPVFTELSARRLGPIRRYFVRHPRAMDLLVIVLFWVPAVGGVLSLAAEQPELRTSVLVVALTLPTVGAVVLLWRRSRPEVVTVVIAVLTAVCVGFTGSTQGFETGLAFALYAVASTRPARIAWWALGATNAAVAAATWFWLGPPDEGSLGRRAGEPVPRPLVDNRILSMLGVTVFCLAAIAIGISVRNRRLHIAQLIDRVNEMARDRDQQAQLARASERARIAREMHDVVAHSLSVMIALADGAGAALTRAPERSRTALDELSATGRSALADMRRVLGVLAEPDAPLEPQPGYLDLDELVERFRTAGVPVRTTGLNEPLPADAGLQLAVYRIVQESLTNTLRHAPASHVDVELRRTNEGIEVDVVDDGATVAVPDAGGAGQGVIGMRERAGVYGGSVDAGPWRGGWRVHAVLPWPEESA